MNILGTDDTIFMDGLAMQSYLVNNVLEWVRER